MLFRPDGKVTLVEPWPGRCATMGNGPAGCLPDQTRIISERTRPMPWRSRLPCPPPFSQLLAIHQQVHRACAGIDPNAIAFAHHCERTTNEGFRRDITDAHSARGAGKAPICDERHLLA